MLAGDVAAAEREYRAASDELQSIGEHGWLSTMAGLWADALYELGRLDEARAAARMSRDTATRDDHNAQAMWRCAEAKLVAREGRFDEAEALARGAIACAEASDELDNGAHIYLGLVEVLRLAGRPADAVEALDGVIARFEQKGNLVMTERTHALREELSAAGG
jgi:tetratricopeptide (TPR) repeat protein